MVAQPRPGSAQPPGLRIRTQTLLRCAKQSEARFEIEPCPKNPTYECTASVRIFDDYGHESTILRIVTYPEVAAKQYAAWQAAIETIFTIWANERPKHITERKWLYETEQIRTMRRQWTIADRIDGATAQLIGRGEALGNLPGAPILFRALGGDERTSLMVYPMRSHRQHYAYIVSITENDEGTSRVRANQSEPQNSLQDVLLRLLRGYAEYEVARDIEREEHLERERAYQALRSNEISPLPSLNVAQASMAMERMGTNMQELNAALNASSSVFAATPMRDPRADRSRSRPTSEDEYAMFVSSAGSPARIVPAYTSRPVREAQAGESAPIVFSATGRHAFPPPSDEFAPFFIDEAAHEDDDENEEGF